MHRKPWCSGVSCLTCDVTGRYAKTSKKKGVCPGVLISQHLSHRIIGQILLVLSPTNPLPLPDPHGREEKELPGMKQTDDLCFCQFFGIA